MSVVACRITEDGYEIAADSIMVRGWTQSKGDNTKFSKLFEVNDLVIGGAGLSEEIGLFRIFSSTRRPSDATEAALVEFVSEFAEWKGRRSDERKMESVFLIGFESKVFYIEGWFIEEVNKYEAIGAGMDYALAALYLGHNAEKAVETAIELSVYCEGPVQVIKK